MPNTPQTGRNTVIIWTPSGGSAITLSTYGRNLEINEEVDEYDTTTYAEAQTGYTTAIPGLETDTASFEVMYQTGDLATFNALKAGTIGTFEVRREGTGVGKPKETWTNAFITSRDRPHEYNDVMIMSTEWRLPGAPTIAVQA